MAKSIGFCLGTGRSETVAELSEIARVAEEVGYSTLHVVDQPQLSRDMQVLMTAAVLSTKSIRIGHGVTQLATMHPLVIANGIATLDELSGGRSFAGLGLGGVAALYKYFTLQEVREAIQFIRSYMSGEEAEYRGQKIHSEWVRRPVPILLAASGPKSIQLGGEVCDALLVGAGANPTFLKWRRRWMEEGAERAGRDPSEVELWVNTLIYVVDKKEDAYHEAASFCATQARGFYDTIFRKPTKWSEELRAELDQKHPGIIEACKRICEEYNPTEHESIDAQHSRLVTDELIDFFFLIGRPEQIIARIEELRDLGATHVSNNNFTIIDKIAWMRDVGRNVIDRFRPVPA